MADEEKKGIRISDMVAAQAVTNNDYLMVAQNGESKKVSTNMLKAYVQGVTDYSENALEKQISYEFIENRTGKVFATKIWHFDTNTTSSGVRLNDSVGLTCTPSTDTVEGTDDFAKASEIFTYKRCNYIREEDGTARPTAIEGRPGFTTTGNVDVGKLAPTFWWGFQNCGTYDMYYMSDSPHDELGLVPFKAAVKADGTVLPFYVLSCYPSVKGDDGYNRSLPGRAPVYNESYNGMIDEYQKKGAGCWGAGMDRLLHGWLMLVIKYATKNSQTVFQGCSGFTDQAKCAVAETGVKRVLLSSQGNFYEGACVSVGIPDNKSDGTANLDRGSAAIGNKADRVKIKSIEKVTVDGTEYTAFNLEADSTFDTTKDTYVTAMPCMSGETDAVIGHHDGSYLSNTNGRHTFRIAGCEYQWGQYVVLSDCVLVLQDKTIDLYVAPKGTNHVKNAHTNYTKSSLVIPRVNGWIGDVALDQNTQAFSVSAMGSGNSVGVGDQHYCDTSGKSGDMREYLAVAYLDDGSVSGLGLLSSWLGLGNWWWDCGSAD